MATHVALLRGINVGGKNKVPMAELREVVTSLGHTEVTTYIQSGNVLFTSSEDDPAKLAAGLEAAITQAFGVQSPVVVLSRDELAQVLFRVIGTPATTGLAATARNWATATKLLALCGDQ